MDIYKNKVFDDNFNVEGFLKDLFKEKIPDLEKLKAIEEKITIAKNKKREILKLYRKRNNIDSQQVDILIDDWNVIIDELNSAKFKIARKINSDNSEWTLYNFVKDDPEREKEIFYKYIAGTNPEERRKKIDKATEIKLDKEKWLMNEKQFLNMLNILKIDDVMLIEKINYEKYYNDFYKNINVLRINWIGTYKSYKYLYDKLLEYNFISSESYTRFFQKYFVKNGISPNTNQIRNGVNNSKLNPQIKSKINEMIECLKKHKSNQRLIK